MQPTVNIHPPLLHPNGVNVHGVDATDVAYVVSVCSWLTVSR